MQKHSQGTTRQLDAFFDNHPDASFGRFREASRAAQAAPVSAPWSQVESSLDEAQSVALSAYLLMNR